MDSSNIRDGPDIAVFGAECPDLDTQFPAIVGGQDDDLLMTHRPLHLIPASPTSSLENSSPPATDTPSLRAPFAPAKVALATFPPAGRLCRTKSVELTCAICSQKQDVVLCSFAFQQVHRRVPLCAEHRAPLTEIDELTRSGRRPGRWPLTSNAVSSRSETTTSERNISRKPARTRPMPTGPNGATVTVLMDRRR